MCSLQEHIERDAHARANAPIYVNLPPQEGMTTKPREHADQCACWHHPEYGHVIGASCVQKWGREALDS